MKATNASIWIAGGRIGGQALQRTDPADDARQYAGEWRSLARGLLPQVLARGRDPRALARRDAGPLPWAADDLLEVRERRR
jgi:hypothetical protein